MKNAYFQSSQTERATQRPGRTCGWLCLSALIASVTMHAQTIAIQSTTDSNGWFRYSFVYSNDGYRVGGTSNSLAVWLPARTLLGVEETPGWTWRTDTADSICWRYTGATPCVLEPGAISFAFTSAWRDTMLYNETSRTGALPCAQISGEWFDTNGMRVATTSATDVRAVNVVSLNRAALVGPAVPEPLLGTWWGIMQCGLMARRRWRGAARQAGRGGA